MKTLPEAFKERMSAQLGAEYGAFISAYELPPVRGIRINTLKMSKERFLDLCPFETEQSPTLDEGLILLEVVPHIGSHPFHIAGLFYVQEPSAMSVIDAADIRSGMRVLDLCAAPGGKSGGIAARLCGRGFLLSNEIVPSRAKQLARNLERLGVVNAAVTSSHPDAIAEALPCYFDRVIVDAPCSGEGMFRKDDTAIAEWSPEHVASCAARQKAILESAEKCVAAGGKLIYSTCTFSLEENEGVVDTFLSAHPEYSLERIERLYPHTVKGEGHFVSVLIKSEVSADLPYSQRSGFDRRSGSAIKERSGGRRTHKQSRGGGSNELAHPNAEQLRIASDFLSEICVFDEGDVPAEHLRVYSGRLISVPFELPQEILDLRIISLGVEVGELIKGRLKPAHGFFMAAHGYTYRNAIELSSSSRELAAFLRGESLEARSEFDVRGEYSRFMPVNVHGCPIGFCKFSDGVLKNHLPKGLMNLRADVWDE